MWHHLDKAKLAADKSDSVPTDEQQIILQAQQGDIAAFNQLVLSYQNMAYSVAYRLLRNQEATSDAVQDSFIKAFRGLGTFKGGNFKSWLMRIVVNTCYDALRSQKRRPTESLDDEEVHQEYTPRLIDKGERPEQYAERMELSEWLEVGLTGLPYDQQVAVILCDIHGYPYNEIAEIIDMPIGTVKSRISRGRARLRDTLLERPELLPGSFRPKHKQ